MYDAAAGCGRSGDSLGIKPRFLCGLGQCSTTELYPKPMTDIKVLKNYPNENSF